MKLVDALKLVNRPLPEEAEPFDLLLACGFTPLHLETLLAAELRLRLPDRRVKVHTGLYGDCLGTLTRLPGGRLDAVVVALEWADFDPRLGIRTLGGWGPTTAEDIAHLAAARCAHLEQAIRRAAELAPIILCQPTLPVPPIAYTPPARYDALSLRLRECIAALGVRLAEAGVRLLNPQRLDACSPLAERFDVRSELASGFPYRVPHAAALAELLADLVHRPAPKKGLITDLDDTLWRGLVGEVGAGAVSWDLDHRSQMHGLYQQLLCSLAEAGVLIAVASKNDPARVEEVFARNDLHLPKDRVFPFEVNWGPKSHSVERILAAWNVGDDSVVFVDDSPMELAEVKARHPNVECLLYPRQDDQAAYALLERLRSLFGKDTLSAEDAIRLDSLRRRAAPAAGGPGGEGSPEFLAAAEAELTVRFAKEPVQPRALELVNKTNQFNLNGKRYNEGAWLTHVRDPDTFVLAVDYKDKFGPLGTIAVLTGSRTSREVTVDGWVMSCRAFARRIEHRCLALLFDRFQPEEITFAFAATPRNQPLQDFFAEFLGRRPEDGFRLSRQEFATKCPPLHHQIKESLT